ncbi:hypothetical protein F5148DRAFT_1184591 [Russula earlei]|uniref:Uncharacterized protein n=1 Tax=Russula earlei TaxID=71964 RepID=A0ACC0UG33_9AGAM|nr:hypothetical protein F5148DRAFT_1184591 [Russula earlei]
MFAQQPVGANPQPANTTGQTGYPSSQSSFFSGFGQQSQQQTGLSATPMQQLTAQSGQPLFTKSTKFNDLPDIVKKTFEDIDTHIQGRVQISKDLKQRKVGEEATKGQDLIRGVHKSVQDTIVGVHIIDGFRNPHHHGAYLRNHANFPLEFFTRITDQMCRRLQSYKEIMEQVERRLTSAAQQTQHTPQAISATLEAQNASFVALANKTAALDADLQRLKALYTQLWRAKTGSMRDPFNQLDRGSGGEFGVESLYGK